MDEDFQPLGLVAAGYSANKRQSRGSSIHWYGLCMNGEIDDLEPKNGADGKPTQWEQIVSLAPIVSPPVPRGFLNFQYECWFCSD